MVSKGFEIFDIKMVYEQHNFSPENLKGNPTMYLAFKKCLKNYLTQFVEKFESNGFFIAEYRCKWCIQPDFQELDEYRI
jgi:hypothetical protein